MSGKEDVLCRYGLFGFIVRIKHDIQKNDFAVHLFVIISYHSDLYLIVERVTETLGELRNSECLKKTLNFILFCL